MSGDEVANSGTVATAVEVAVSPIRAGATGYGEKQNKKLAALVTPSKCANVSLKNHDLLNMSFN